MQHEDAHILITGGTSGIGAALAAAYRDDGASVTITGTRATAADYDADLSGFRYMRMDVEDDESVRVVADATERVDVLVNNAAAPLRALGLDEWEPDVFARAVAMHLTNAYRLSHALKPKLTQSTRASGGSILSIGSMSSLFGLKSTPGYGAGKTGLLGITRAMAAAWGRENIRANMLVLGLIETPMTRGALERPGFADSFIARTPLGRVGLTADCTGPALFLSGPGASFITGQMIVVDGGYSIQG